MKKHENIITTIGAVALLLGVMLTPSIHAMMLEGKTVETTTKTVIMKEDKMIENNEYEPVCPGSIYGEIVVIDGWSFHPGCGILVEARIGNTVIGRDFSNVFGYYRIRGISVGYTYTVIACPFGSGYDSVTEIATLTSDKPCAEIDFILERNHNSINLQMYLNSIIYKQLEQLYSSSYQISQNNLLLQATMATNK